MHILVTSWRDIKNPLSGGAEILTHEIAKRLVKRGHKITIVSGKYPNASARESINGVSIIRPTDFYPTNFTSYLRWPLFLSEVRKIIRSHEPNPDIIVDQIHGLPSFTPLYSIIPTILFPLEFADKIWDYEVPFPGNLIGKMLERTYIAKFQNHHFIVISASVASEFKLLGVKNVHTITPGITLPRKSTHTKSKRPTFISLGRITPMKRIEETIKAFAIVQQKTPQSQLHILGRGKPSYIRFLQDKINQLNLNNNVQIHGFVSEEDKRRLLASSWAILSTSVKEGWGLNIIEAASLGTPSIAYVVTGIVDSIQNNRTGLLSKQNKPQSVASLMNKLIDNPKLRARLSNNAITYATQFTWSRTTDEFLNAINKTADH